MTLSVIVPFYNEETSIKLLVSKVLQIQEVTQVIAIDDGSTDNSFDILNSILDDRLTIIRHKGNQGKGASIRTAQKLINGEITIIQDADLEYNPEEYSILTRPIRDGLADVVYGSRFQTSSMRRVLYFWHYVGNRVLTLFSNMFTNLNLSDMETCYKAINSELFKQIEIKENRFGFEPEITCKLAKKKVRFYEVSISYHGRTYEEGKKIGIRDAFRALYCIIRYSL